jgi:hypothetical protein
VPELADDAGGDDAFDDVPALPDGAARPVLADVAIDDDACSSATVSSVVTTFAVIAATGDGARTSDVGRRDAVADDRYMEAVLTSSSASRSSLSSSSDLPALWSYVSSILCNFRGSIDETVGRSRLRLATDVASCGGGDRE